MKFNPLLTRKDLLRAVELGMDLEVGESTVLRPAHAKYEIRATRKPSGVDLKWGALGKFYKPDLSRFEEVK